MLSSWCGLDSRSLPCYDDPMNLTEYRNSNDAYYMREANGDIDLACRIMWDSNEHFDGEYVIGYGAEVAMRERLGFDATVARRKLAEAQAYENECEAEYVARHPRAGR
jgi:hypothetical protein